MLQRDQRRSMRLVGV